MSWGKEERDEREVIATQSVTRHAVVAWCPGGKMATPSRTTGAYANMLHTANYVLHSIEGKASLSPPATTLSPTVLQQLCIQPACPKQGRTLESKVSNHQWGWQMRSK